MTYNDLFKELNKNLNEEDQILLKYIFKEEISDYHLRKDEIIEKNKEKRIVKLYKKSIILKKPIQYLLKYSYFYNLKLHVSKHTLIPRFETEILVELVLNYIKENTKERYDILDIGTGSGAISIAILKNIENNENIFVKATDINKRTLDVAKQNAITYGVNIDLVKQNLLKDEKTKYNIVMFNPPYIQKSEKLDKRLKYEPKRALFALDNGLEYYKKILVNIKSILKEDYFIIFETSPLIYKEVLRMYEKEFEKCEIIKDYNKKERFIIIKNART
jgi:release factor glutamine methyltransferase